MKKVALSMMSRQLFQNQYNRTIPQKSNLKNEPKHPQENQPKRPLMHKNNPKPYHSLKTLKILKATKLNNKEARYGTAVRVIW